MLQNNEVARSSCAGSFALEGSVEDVRAVAANRVDFWKFAL